MLFGPSRCWTIIEVGNGHNSEHLKDRFSQRTGLSCKLEKNCHTVKTEKVCTRRTRLKDVMTHRSLGGFVSEVFS